MSDERTFDLDSIGVLVADTRVAAAKFDLKVEKPMKITLKYNILIEGSKLTGKCKMGIFGSAKLAGYKM